MTTPWTVNRNGRISSYASRTVLGARVSVHRDRRSWSGFRKQQGLWWVQINAPFAGGEWVRIYNRPEGHSLEAVMKFADRMANRVVSCLRTQFEPSPYAAVLRRRA